MTRLLPGLLLLALAACAGSSNGLRDGGTDAGPLDICNSAANAKDNTQCELLIVPTPAADAGVAGQQYYIDHAGKQLWLWIQLPATVPPRTLFHLVAGYSAPSTSVDLSINLLEANLTSSLGLQVDSHGAGKPGVLDFTFSLDPTLTPPGSLVWAEVTDAANTNLDVHNPFNIYVDLVPDPDQNVGVTPITLGSPGAGSVQNGTCANGDGGACQGVLSVEGREDVYTISIPDKLARPILYMDLSATTLNLSPPPLYDLAYSLANDAGTVINSGNVPNPFTTPNLATALLVDPGETYTLDVFGLNPNVTPPAQPGPGDLRITYSLDVEVLPDLDTNEPNDTIGEALSHPVDMVLGTPKTLTGRLAYVDDEDWFILKFPSSATSYTRLHYKITPGATGSGRYPVVTVPPLTGPDRIETVSLDLSGANASATCLEDPAQCPRDPTYTDDTSSYQGQLFTSLCNDGDGDGGALCLLSGRNEIQAVSEGFAPLQNFEGFLPLNGTGPQTLYLDFQSSSGNYCDDIPYTLLLDWEPMPGQPASSMTDPIVSSFPFDESGVLAAGYGYLVQYNLTESPPVDVRGEDDYDAIPSNIDTYEVDFPAADKSAALGASWGLSWTLASPAVETLLLGVTFCTADGTCTAGGPGKDGVNGAIYYNSIDYHPWWDTSGDGWYTGDEFAALWNETMGSGGTTITASPFACTCFQADYLAGGKFYVTVQGADRTAWTDTNYTLDMSISAYPGSFVLDGGTYPCPTSHPDPLGVVDAGVKVDGGTVQILIDAGYPQGCEFITGFRDQGH